MSERTFQKSVSVLTARSEPKGIPESVDACRRPCGENNTWTPDIIKDRGNSHLAWLAVYQSDAVRQSVPERTGSLVTGLRT
jgi:hypothetical protein